MAAKSGYEQRIARQDRRALIQQVRRHAEKHYEDGGWDVVVECWEDVDIDAQIGKARTLKGAIGKFSGIVDVWADQQAEAEYQGRQ